ncbi:MAG: glucose PTS transporter subunit IIA [Micrococcaceae bacterium]
MSTKSDTIQYHEIANQILAHTGGKENIQQAFHCATRLRLDVKDPKKVDIDAMEDLPLAKGMFIQGNQLQIIFGGGLVDDVTAEFINYTRVSGTKIAGQEVDTKGSKGNVFGQFIKTISDVFIDIIPAILAAGILTGITSVLKQPGVFGSKAVIDTFPAISGFVEIWNIGASGIFAMLPLLVIYSATKRYGGRPVLGLAMGTVMMSAQLPSLAGVASGKAQPMLANIFGWQVHMTGFQGGIIAALIMGWVVAKTDNWLQTKIPSVLRLVFVPMLTILFSSLALFIVVGPISQVLSTGITNALVWITETFGIFGYMFFAGTQQLVVITGLHNMFPVIEAQLIATTGKDWLNPLMSVALMAQGGAALAYMALNWANKKTKETVISAFSSIIFGISEPTIFGVTLKYKYPLIGGCIGGAFAGAYVYLVQLTSIAFGTTALPGISIANPENNGYLHYLIANILGALFGFIATFGIGIFANKKYATKPKSIGATASAEPTVLTTTTKKTSTSEETIKAPATGKLTAMEELHDPAFSSGAMGKGIGIIPDDGKIYAPVSGTVETVFPTKHAYGIISNTGAELLIHIGLDTVKLKGKGFKTLVKQGDEIKQGQHIATVDLDTLKAQGIEDTVLCFVTNAKTFSKVNFKDSAKHVSRETLIGKIEK